MKFNNLLMKYLCKLICGFFLYHIIYLSYVASAGISSYLKIDIIEAVNLHCILNDEFYCNPYTIIEFKYSENSRSTQPKSCTKNPAWDSSFVFQPDYCKDVVYIYFYQFLTPKDNAYLGDAVIYDDLFEKGNIKPGYLGRIIIQLEKLSFGIIDEWFMIETPVDNSRIMFPSCAHLRIYWTSSDCQEPSAGNVYAIKSALEKISPVDQKIRFEPSNYIGLCKKDFANIYKSKFSILDSDTPIKKISEKFYDDRKRIDDCLKDPNQDYGFNHSSNLTSIEEALAYKIIKRVTGEDIDYSEFTSDFQKVTSTHLKTFRDFFEKECFEKPDLTIERINNILALDAEDLQLNTTNPYLSVDEKSLELPYRLAWQRKNNVYSTTLNQFNSLEDIKSLDKMDDESYLKSLNKIVRTIKDMDVENKTDYTIFYSKNKVIMTNEGLVHPKEEMFFRVHALYKWNGGHVEYDELKKEFMLRRKNFYCYELIKLMPTNIIFQFVDEDCPANYVCIDPNGIVINSIGKDPRIIFSHELNKNGVDGFANFHKNLENDDDNKAPREKRINMRFKSLESKKSSTNNNLKKTMNANSYEKISNSLLNKETKLKKFSSIQNDEQSSNNDLINFQKLLTMESGTIVPADTLPDVNNDDENLWLNKFDRLYYERRKRIALKKEIIINKIFTHIPILGEILAVANLQMQSPDGDNINDEFLERETNLFKKYLLIYDSKVPFVEKAAKVLLNLVLCNTDVNRLKYILNEMLEGLCFGDDRSIKIFEEIMRTIIIDTLISTKYLDFEDLHAKANLLRTFNKPFCFKTMTKIKFIERMIMLEVLKEKITYILWNNDTNKKILLKIIESENSIPVLLPENKRLFSYDKNLGFDNIRNINRNFLSNLSNMKNEAMTERLNSDENRTFKFKSIETNENSSKDVEKEISKVIDKLDADLNIEYNEEKSKAKKLKEKNDKPHKIIHNQILHKNISNNSIDIDKTKYKNNNFANEKMFLSSNLLKDLADEDEYFKNFYKNNTTTDMNDKEQLNFEKKFESIYNENQNPKSRENELTPQNRNKEGKITTNEKDLLRDISNKFEYLKRILKTKNSDRNNKNKIKKTKSMEDKLIDKIQHEDFSVIFNDMKFKELNREESQTTSSAKSKESQNENLNENSQNFPILSLHEYNNPNIYEKHDRPGINVLGTENQPSQKDILEKVLRDPQTRRLLENVRIDPKNKILLPKEIHNTYEVNRKGVKQITINNNNPTKNLILKTLMDENTFNDLMQQNEPQQDPNVSDQTGLFTVLKNIQNRKCSCDFLCIEIGAIYGPFDALKPKHVSIMTNHKEKVQLVIKPILIVNNTNTPVYPIIPNKTYPIPSANITNLFENEDCDLLTMGGSSISINGLANNNNFNGQNYGNARFKQSESDQNVNNNMPTGASNMNYKNNNKNTFPIKRKFYRKLEYANEILANDIFKQGLNLIILKREQGYPKTYERTFNTNYDPIESDAMACIIRDNGYDKIIVVTGIGKWMGAMTPRLIKEIKQIGGPDLNRLVSIDSMDNAELDHSFILIGRRGLCRYNGVFRVKNYDIAKDLKKFFPDLSSDPNDCYFENVNFENAKNKPHTNLNYYKNDNRNKKADFYHLIDLRFTLNLANDNRFSYKAPIITSVSPASGPVSGNQKIEIFGYNFGNSLLDIKEVLVRGVVCKNIEFISSSIISCYTGSSSIMGAGPGNVIIKLFCGLSSPINTCNMYEYNAQMADIIIDNTNKKQINVIKVNSVNIPRTGMLIPQTIPSPVIPNTSVITSVHNIKPSPFLPIFSFKEKESQNNNNKYNDYNKFSDEDVNILQSLKEKIENYDFNKKPEKSKIDNLVTDNFKKIMNYAENNGFGVNKDGFRKKRFRNLVSQIK